MMVNHSLRIAYFSIPKVACTSLKSLMFTLEHGREFDEVWARPDDVEHVTVHNHYPARAFSTIDHAALQGYWKFAVVRDPIQRVISCYTDKVRDKQVMLTERLRHDAPEHVVRTRETLDPMPGLDRFARNLMRYRACSRTIFHHTRRFHCFLGPDLGYFDAVYRIDQLDDLCAELSRRAGRPVSLDHRNRSLKAGSTPKLRSGAYDRLRAFTAPDYALLEGVYAPPPRPSAPWAQRPGTGPAPYRATA